MKLYALFLLLLAFTAQVAWGQLTAKPEEVKWSQVSATFSADKMTIGTYAKLVDDAKATDGKAVTVTAGEGRDSYITSGGWAPVRRMHATRRLFACAWRWRMSPWPTRRM